MASLDSLFRELKDINRRLQALEMINHSKVLLFSDDLGMPRILIDGVNGVIKVSRDGYDVTTAANVNLAFNSNFSAFREVQFQTNAEQRFTDQSAYQSYNDCQIQINFSDWTEATFYFEGVVKTGAGTGYVELQDLGSSISYGEIQTTSTTAGSVRSNAGMTGLTGVHNFRERQKITGGGGAFTDIYIGRLVIRYDF